MDSQRNRIIEISDYLQKLGIEVNIGKNKARGNKGFFKAISNKFRIDIAKGLDEETIVGVLTHEFAHYLHYCFDKKLQSLDFIFEGNDLTEELIELTVASIPKSSISPIFELKEKIISEIKQEQEAGFSFKLKYLQKELRRINSRISRLNRYYNTQTELFARSLEMYVTKPEVFKNKAPEVYKCYENAVCKNKIPILTEFIKISLQKI